MFLHFLRRMWTLKADWLISYHRLFPASCTFWPKRDINLTIFLLWYWLGYRAIIACLKSWKMVVVTKSIEDAISQGISDIQLVYSRSIQLKEERAICDLLRGKDVFVLYTGYGKSLICQVFVRVWGMKHNEMQLFVSYWYEALSDLDKRRPHSAIKMFKFGAYVATTRTLVSSPAVFKFRVRVFWIRSGFCQ